MKYSCITRKNFKIHMNLSDKDIKDNMNKTINEIYGNKLWNEMKKTVQDK